MHQNSLPSLSGWMEALKLALDLISDPVFLLDPRSFQILSANQAATGELGYLCGELCGKDWEAVAMDWDSSSLLEMAQPETTAISSPIKLLRKDGSLVSCVANLGITKEKDERVVVLVCKPVEQAVHREHDWLTGIASRSALEQQLRQTLSLAAQTEKACAVFFIDLDGFKLVNDTWGHRVGDMVLRKVADRLSSLIRPSDLLARYGGDEFVIIFKDLKHPSETEAICERIRSALDENIIYGEQQIRISASIGIAISSGIESAEELMDQADRAMYLAKSQARQNQLSQPAEVAKSLAD